MDLLKKELERKKKAVALAREKTAAGSRFFKAADLRRAQEDEEERLRLKRQRDLEIEKQEETLRKADTESDKDAEAKQPLQKKARSNSLADLSPADLLIRLRELGLPIKLFGESVEIRMQRLKAALDRKSSKNQTQTEKDEYRLGMGHGIRNPFLDRKQGDEQKDDTAVEKKKDDLDKQEDEDEDISNDPHKRIYKYFKGLLKQWEDDLALRPEAVKRTAAGKNETKTLKQCKDYIKPLFKLCKTRKLEEGLLHNILKIVDFCQEDEFVKAHDAYIDVAIGRAAWPIGVTMVGIHARSGRAKIESSNVAHVMNSELQRKYLTSVKRLLSYAQKKAENVAPSKKVMN
jgi:pre-mRNA-splicing factor 18